MMLQGNKAQKRKQIMAILGNLKKMRATLGSPIQYLLDLGDASVQMNDLIGQEIHFHYTGLIHCKICGRKTKKAYGEGFCFPHFKDHPANSPCILKPELCEGHLGKGRDVEWEQENHVKPHVVYLALTNVVKVGVTRQKQVPTRWIDQGAWKVIRLAEPPYRQLAGQIEVALKSHVTDKTNWRKMLTGIQAEEIDLLAEKERLHAVLEPDLQAHISPNDEVLTLDYPVETYPQKVKSVGFDKQPDIGGVLQGIRGQYLFFEDGVVLNLRKHTSYQVELSF